MPKGSHADISSEPTHFAIVLAAGASTRMGRCKAMLPWLDQQTLLAYQAVQWLLAHVTPILVLSPDNTACRFLCPPESWIVINPDPGRGKTSSVLTGLSVLPPSCQTIALTAVDQPRSASIYRRLLQAHQQAESWITAPRYGDRLGHPILFSDCLRPELLSIQEKTQGIRQIVQRHAASLLSVEFDTPAVLRDLNTPEHYQTELRQEVMQQAEQ